MKESTIHAQSPRGKIKYLNLRRADTENSLVEKERK